MKRIIIAIGLAMLLLVSGCATTDEIVMDTTPRQPTTAVEVFKDGRVPDRRYKEIAELSYLGPREEELTAQKFFMKRAQKLGGNGILFAVVPGGEKSAGLFGPNGGGFGSSTAWVFKGKVFVYE